jgi:hypothetical protein
MKYNVKYRFNNWLEDSWSNWHPSTNDPNEFGCRTMVNFKYRLKYARFARTTFRNQFKNWNTESIIKIIPYE